MGFSLVLTIVLLVSGLIFAGMSIYLTPHIKYIIRRLTPGEKQKGGAPPTLKATVWHWMVLIISAIPPAVVATTGLTALPDSSDVPSPLPTPFISAVELASQEVSHNQDWNPYVQPVGGVPMALVPVGCFMMGNDDGLFNERPAHQQCIERPFWIDIYEVTNDLYGSAGVFEGHLRPRDSITWFEANNFCEERGGRLPTEVEWEYAARGPDNLIYPWGNSFDANNVVYAHTTLEETTIVGTALKGVSWVGALDMSGNVLEWTSTIYNTYPYTLSDNRENSSDKFSARVLRGGSWTFDMDIGLHATVRYTYDPYVQYNDVGFRCVAD